MRGLGPRGTHRAYDRARDDELAVQRGLPEGSCGPSRLTRRAVADARSGLLAEQEVQGRDVTLGEGSDRRDIHVPAAVAHRAGCV